MASPTSLYDQDMHAWTLKMAELLRAGRFSELDTAHLAEELEDMGKRDRRELVSHFMVLIAHLLKWQSQPDQRSSGWRGSIVEQRVQVPDQLDESPSLKPYLAEAITKAYKGAVEIAAVETGLTAATFPPQCPYTVADLLDRSYYPA